MNKRRLLIIDEDAKVRDMLSDAFDSQFDVLATRSLEEALREATYQHPHCILLDMGMPQMGASTACETLKSMKETESIPIVLMGEYPRDAVWVTAKKMGGFDYIEKPFSIAQVSKMIRSASELPPIERRRSRRMFRKVPYVIRGKDIYERDFEVSSVTEGVSRHGLLVRLPVRIPVGEDVEVFQSEPVGAKGVAILTRARVVWNDGEGIRGPFWHGLEFQSASPGWTPD
jgi:CheY-like chemotaxis protein